MTKANEILNMLSNNRIGFTTVTDPDPALSAGFPVFVKTGTLNLFCSNLNNNGTESKKFFIASFGENEMVLPVKPFTHRNERTVLSAVPSETAEFIMADISIIDLFKIRNESSHFLHRLFYNWIDKLSSPLMREINEGKCREISLEELDRSNGIFVLDSHEEFKTSHGIVWTFIKEGFCVICGKEENVLMAEGSIFPLSSRLWMKTLDRSVIELKYASEVFEGNNFETFTNAFYDTLFRIFLLSKLYHADSVKHRNKMLSLIEEEAINESINKLSDFDSGNNNIKASANQNISQPILQIIGEVCSKSGIKFIQTDDETQGNISAEENIIRILEKSQIPYRKAYLEKNWFRTEGRNMIGFEKISGEPVGLILKKGSGYYISKMSKKTKRLSDRENSVLSNYAYELYPCVNKRSIPFLEIIRAISGNVKTELKNAALISTCAGTSILLLPYFTGKIFDEIIPHAEIYQLLQATAVLLTATLSYALFKVCKAFIMLRIKAISDYGFQHIVPVKLLKAPSSFYREHSGGELIQRAISANSFHEVMTGNVLNSIFCIFMALPSLAMMAIYSPFLATAGFASGLIFLMIIGGISFLNSKNIGTELEARGNLSSFIIQTITGINKIRMSASENRIFVKWAAKFSPFAKSYSANIANKSVITITEGIYPVIMTGVFFYFAGSLCWNDLDKGKYLAFISAFTIFTAGLTGLGAGIPSLFTALNLFKRMKPILDTSSEAYESICDTGIVHGKIELKNVSFKYSPDAPLALDGLNLCSNPGEYIVITGPSGAGKSTVARILSGLEKPVWGNMQYGGIDIEKINSKTFRKSIGAVLQNDNIISGSIYHNIAISSWITLKDSINAARIADLENDISKMPMGMQTFVSDNNISGGQKQKILIARAIARKPEILIIDEALSEIDKRSRNKIIENIRRTVKTLIVITHDKEVMENADKVFKIIDGKNADK